ncbi:MAG: DNA mismatch repair protein MutT [Gammaproteobacteria bacterium HGW-Gammaproteobacteria-3]|nr:MAG: DNA mismatch repair protein MutT [Gammaproteobacteria bacterium HGW-Gammaproteobacteria-3]
MKKVLPVAVGVIKNPAGEVLIGLRHRSAHQGGLWEFPGGKIEPGETVEQALARELKEELAIDMTAGEPLMTLHHDYGDLCVRLIVWTVDRYIGLPESCEGQPLKWVKPSDLIHFSFPEANRPIISAINLPPFYALLDGPDPAVLLKNLAHILDHGVKLVQARLKALPKAAAIKFIEQAYPLCRQAGARLLLNSSIQGSASLAADGIHLTGEHLLAWPSRPEKGELLAASCHSAAELQKAQQLGVDFAVLAPVLPTTSHPGAAHLGWERFAALVAPANVPVYALGGLALTDLAAVRRAGGQGIAGISAFLP